MGAPLPSLLPTRKEPEKLAGQQGAVRPAAAGPPCEPSRTPEAAAKPLRLQPHPGVSYLCGCSSILKNGPEPQKQGHSTRLAIGGVSLFY
ncbi:hypothetical protein H920_11479 [Fukomys damarensis]|uniref:Uncharacterized protein n=1 Tax=Fukomys damarensis TaxID=885580 RepID=A0A091D4P8_FUKDA|nr:hypothetical protein H920_11479 [Fukomys damarensis]